MSDDGVAKAPPKKRQRHEATASTPVPVRSLDMSSFHASAISYSQISLLGTSLRAPGNNSEQATTSTAADPVCTLGVVVRRRRIYKGLIFMDIVEAGSFYADPAARKPRQFLELKVVADEGVANVEGIVGDAASELESPWGREGLPPGQPLSKDSVHEVHKFVSMGDLVLVAGHLTLEKHDVVMLRVARLWRAIPAKEFEVHPLVDRKMLHSVIYAQDSRTLVVAHGSAVGRPELIPLCHTWALSLFQELSQARDTSCLRGEPNQITTTGNESHPTCHRRHHFLDPNEESRWHKRQARAEQAREEATSESDPHKDKKAKARRAFVFVEWLLTKFGREYLSSGVGVLDVAGGRGSVSFELFNKHGIPATLIEPRERKLDRLQHLWLATQPEDSRGLAPHIRKFVFSESLDQDAELAELIRGCSVVLGLHSDEATEPIVDVALKANVPFAVVPCCTFTRQHPERPHVRTTLQFVEYLRAKAGSKAAVEYLDFKGRNAVVFSTFRKQNLPSPQTQLDTISKDIGES